MYKPKHFALHELVDPQIYEIIGENAWKLLNEGALKTLDQLRDKFGALYVNTWYRGGSYKESGLRRANTNTGSSRSQHRVGCAFDCKFKNADIEEVYQYILENQQDFPYIKRIENISATPTWLHFDVKETGQSEIYVFNP